MNSSSAVVSALPGEHDCVGEKVERGPKKGVRPSKDGSSQETHSMKKIFFYGWSKRERETHKCVGQADNIGCDFSEVSVVMWVWTLTVF